LHKPQKFEYCHFGIFEVMGLKNMASRSPSMTGPPAAVYENLQNGSKIISEGHTYSYRQDGYLTSFFPVLRQAG
jgi:hypothetical protein